MLGLARPAWAATLTDQFADRETIQTDSGQVLGSNVGATLEPDEPRHGGKPGGHSVWISWTAPADGIAAFDTTGSSFDTLLGVYVLQPGIDSPMKRLQEAARNDDNGTAKTSLVQFGATAGTRYEVAIDGYAGAVGAIHLNWSLLRSSDPPPIVLNVPPDRSLRAGDTLTLTVAYQADKSVKLAWFFNDFDLPGQEGATLIITNFQATNTGLYKLRFTAGNIRFFTEPIEIQINSEGLTNTLARDKLLDAEDSGLKGQDDHKSSGLRIVSVAAAKLLGSPLGTVRGYNGTQVFNTSFATSDPNEPQHCGVAGGASYWFAYQAPTNGMVTLNTDGSNFDTVLAVYTFDPPLLGYPGLIPVNCDNNDGANGRTSRLQFLADSVRMYLVVVDGVNGARGIAYLNYTLQSTGPVVGTSPVITRQPLSQNVCVGTAVSFAVTATGSQPLHYLWSKDGLLLANADAAVLAIPQVRDEDAGTYQVVITNLAGSASSLPAPLDVLGRPKLSRDPASTAVTVTIPVAGPTPLAVEFTDQLGPANWTPWLGPLFTNAGSLSFTTDSKTNPTRFFRLRVP